MSSELTKIPPSCVTITGLLGSARAWWIANQFRTDSRLLVVVADNNEAELLRDDLAFFLRDVEPQIFPAWDTLPFEPVSPQVYLTAQRNAVLQVLSENSSCVIIAPVQSLIQKIAPRSWRTGAFKLTISQSESLSLADLNNLLHRSWYQRSSIVQEVGEYAVRGSVIDFFPPFANSPVRVEFNGNQISRLVNFDLESQRSLDSIEEVNVVPVRELPPRIENQVSTSRHGLEQIKARGRMLETPPREIARAMSAYRILEDSPGIELTVAVAQADNISFFDELDSDIKIVICDKYAIAAEVERFCKFISEREKRLCAEHFLIPTASSTFLSESEISEALSSRCNFLVDTLGSQGEEDKSVTIRCEGLTVMRNQLKTKIGSGDAFIPLAAAINRFRRSGAQVAISVGSTTRAERLRRILLELNLDAQVSDDNAGDWLVRGTRYPLVILQGHLSAGVRIIAENLVFIAEQEIFSERSYRKNKVRKTSLKRLLASLAQLSEGDHVVHVDYGIGIYTGLSHIEIEGSEGDFLNIQYADSVLYLPVHNISKVQKFIAAEGQAPALDKLGSNQWVKTKERVKQAVLPLAGDLIKLYAARSISQGWRYEPYGAEDERFADEFPYDETPDQLKAIEDTIKDMATDKPMDRLVCGDVGFGKTEVAVRAAFKCVQHRRQVALLVPTTLLVDQHVRTFQSRFQGYDVAIAGLSRFHSAEHNRQTLAKLASGELDIVIGTHKLLSRNVEFKDLGLLMIDEEHRFGVKHKEHLKALRKAVDVLTLTATPIPRTLHMSLLGIRDISVISTPPVDRRVIRSYVAAYDDAVVRDAIMRELGRGGQAFYVHNRVESIDLCTAKLAELVPEARFAFAHGQMSEHQLEEIMRQFLDYKIDVLVSTTIIESGLDIPSANTILIERSDTFGLAQLYQLRGRVGRSDAQAYCYFLVPKTMKLSGEAHRRLKALQSLDELGLGFNLAVRDLEIRGAGNLLGREQSGNVLAVGFELYSKILKEAVVYLKGEELEVEEVVDPEIKLGIHAFIPDFYIPDVSERLIMYQRLSAGRSNSEIDELWSEMNDRFGPPPHEVFELAELMRFRALLRNFGVVRVEQRSNIVFIAFNLRAPIDPSKFMELAKVEPARFRLAKNLTLTITFEELPTPGQIFREVERALIRMKAK